MTQSFKNNIVHVFVWASVVILLATALGKMLSGTFGTVKVLNEYNFIFGIQNRHLMLAVASVELAIVTCILAVKPLKLKLLFINSLVNAFLAYRLLSWVIGAPKSCPCVGYLSDGTSISPNAAYWLVDFSFFFMLFGSYIALMYLHGKSSDSDQQIHFVREVDICK